jgi:hypothetical protein
VRASARSSILAALLALACPTRAWAGDAEDADALITRGVDLREHGKDDEALAVFKQALARSPTPRARAQVALAEQALGMWVAAEADLLSALGAKDDAWIVKNRAPLEGALGVVRRHLGSLEVRGADGADVTIDGVKLGSLPAKAPFRVEAGRRTIEVTAKGFHPTSRAIEIPAGGVARETVTLVALPAESGEPNAPPRGGSGRSDAFDDSGHGQRLLGWVFVGTGGAMLAAGGVTLLVRSSIVDDYNARCPGLGAAQPADCDSKIESARTWLTVSIVSFVAGGVFATGGLALVLSAPRSSGSSAGGAAAGVTRAWCAPGALALTCGATFW